MIGAWSANDPFFAGPGRERKAAAVIYTRGVYSPGAPLVFGADFHSTFLNDWLRFASFTDVTEVTEVTELRHQPTVLTATPDDDRNAAIAAAATADNTV
ncbi:MAG: hypothetical protein ACJ72I_16040 [Pseudonocardiaceae bacterium]